MRLPGRAGDFGCCSAFRLELQVLKYHDRDIQAQVVFATDCVCAARVGRKAIGPENDYRAWASLAELFPACLSAATGLSEAFYSVVVA